MRRSVSRRLAFASVWAGLASIAFVVSCTGDDPPFLDPRLNDAGGPDREANVAPPDDAAAGAGDGDADADREVPRPPATPFFLQFPQSKTSAGAGPFVRQDRSNNTFVAFTFRGSFTVGRFTLTSTSQSEDFAILKLSPDGSVLWANKFGGDQADSVNALAVDRSGDGPVYIVGEFASAVLQFDDAHRFTNTAATSTHPFIAGFDDATGGLIDAYDYAAASSSGTCDSIDAAGGNLLVGCSIVGDITIPHAGGTANLTGNPDRSNALFARLTPDLKATWANVIGGQLDETARAVTIGTDGASYGALSTNSSDLSDRNGFGINTVPGSQADYIFQFEPGGKAAWGFPLARTEASFADIHALVATPQGVTFSGELGGTMTFGSNPGPALTATANSTKHDVLVGALDTSGNAQWVRHYGGSNNISGTFTVAVEGSTTFTAAQTSTTIDVDGVTVLNANEGQRLAFLAEVRPDAGDAQAPFVRFPKPLETPAASYSTGIVVSSDFMVWSGTFNANTDFGGGQTAMPTSDGGFDGFVLGFKR
jgi:hypothetical protein